MKSRFTKVLSTLIRNRRVSQRHVAETIGVSDASLSNYLRGNRSEPRTLDSWNEKISVFCESKST